jgi:hypothetical protein
VQHQGARANDIVFEYIRARARRRRLVSCQLHHGWRTFRAIAIAHAHVQLEAARVRILYLAASIAVTPWGFWKILHRIYSIAFFFAQVSKYSMAVLKLLHGRVENTPSGF